MTQEEKRLLVILSSLVLALVDDADDDLKRGPFGRFVADAVKTADLEVLEVRALAYTLAKQCRAASSARFHQTARGRAALRELEENA